MMIHTSSSKQPSAALSSFRFTFNTCDLAKKIWVSTILGFITKVLLCRQIQAQKYKESRFRTSAISAIQSSSISTIANGRASALSYKHKSFSLIWNPLAWLCASSLNLISKLKIKIVKFHPWWPAQATFLLKAQI